MERELRLKAFMEEYSRIVQLFDDIVAMKESMTRLETYMIIMVGQVAFAMVFSPNFCEHKCFNSRSFPLLIGASCSFCCFAYTRTKDRGENTSYSIDSRPIHHLERNERQSLEIPKASMEHRPSQASTRTVRFSLDTSPSSPIHEPSPPSSSASSSHCQESSPDRPSYSSIPTIDRTISEDSLLIIRKL